MYMYFKNGLMHCLCYIISKDVMRTEIVNYLIYKREQIHKIASKPRKRAGLFEQIKLISLMYIARNSQDTVVILYNKCRVFFSRSMVV